MNAVSYFELDSLFSDRVLSSTWHSDRALTNLNNNDEDKLIQETIFTNLKTISPVSQIINCPPARIHTTLYDCDANKLEHTISRLFVCFVLTFYGKIA